MTHVSAIATYLPCWGSARGRVAGGDEDAVTLAVEAGRAAIGTADEGVADLGADGQGAVRRRAAARLLTRRAGPRGSNHSRTSRSSPMPCM